MRRAAVDVGSNSVRLLAVDEDGAPLAREMTITRLGRGVDERGHLDDDALARTLDTIAAYRDRWRSFDVDEADVRIAATSAVRDASDRDRFFDGVRELTGIEAQVLSGDEEARTAFLGATRGAAVDGTVVVVDIGGGSTELIVGDDERVRGAVSLQLGSVRLTERLLASDPPTSDQIEAARAEVRRQLGHGDQRLADQDVALSEADQLIGVAGTVTTIGALHLGLETYEPDAIHGTVVDRDAVMAITSQLLELPAAGRAELGPMQPGREDVIHGGALILAGLLEHAGFDRILVSEHDILDGLALP